MGLSQFPPAAGGVPTGITAARPASPSTGDVFYNGTLALLEIYDGTNWVPCSSPAAQPTITATDVGTSRAYGSGQITVTFTEGSVGGPAAGFTASASSYTQTSTSSPITLTVGNNATYSVSGTAYNGFGVSPSSPSVLVDVTTVPQAPTIVTASTSSVTTNITVNWTLGDNGGKNLTAITITPYLGGTTAQTAVTAATTSSTSTSITGLTAGSSYTFKVKTTNANGDSLESSASNSITVPYVFDYLVVAGGGGNQVGQGGQREAGSGAGGMRTGNATYSAGTTYTVTVGAGGTGKANGGNSSITGSGFTTISCTGGGYGGNGDNTPGANGGNGGSGGGAWYSNGSAGTGVSGEGFAGSIGYGSPEYGGAGGGKGGAGGRGTNNGPGEASSITGTSVTYATGGKANEYAGTNRSANGAANTGDGASGAANGGSGIVVIKTSLQAASTTGSPSNPSTGLYIFNANGSITF